MPRPELLSKVFVHSDAALGLYVVRFFKNGSWHQVAVDDYFPAASTGGRASMRGRPLFAHANSNHPWINVLEKAYAKVTM